MLQFSYNLPGNQIDKEPAFNVVSSYHVQVGFDLVFLLQGYEEGQHEIGEEQEIDH